MRIVIPASGADIHLLDDHLDVLLHFGGLEAHTITFAPAMSVRPIVEAAIPRLGELCGDISILPLQFEGDGRWPESPNRHWTMTMEALAVSGNTSPVFWNELDCTAMSRSWASDLEAGWRASRVPFYGKLVPTPHRNNQDEIVFEPGDLMMMGCAVYPANITQMPNWRTYTKGFMVGSNPIPFDVFLRGMMVKMGWADTNLIGDRWNTVNYRREGESFVCDPGPTSFKGRDHSKTDVTGCAILHGCKDGSLARLILDEHLNGKTERSAAVASVAEIAPKAEKVSMRLELPTTEFLQECLRYEPETGKLIWNERPASHFPNEARAAMWNGKFKDREAGCKQYAENGDAHCIRIRLTDHGKAACFVAHRIIFQMLGCEVPDGMEIDHRNLDPHDNSLENLRLSSASQNCANRRSPNSSTRQLPKGVCFREKTGKYLAQITIDGIVTHLGCFETKEEAAKVYLDAALKTYGEFARINQSVKSEPVDLSGMNVESPECFIMECTDTSTEVSAPASKPEAESIREAVCDKRIQIGNLAKMLSMDKEELRAIIGKPESRLSLVKGWVGLEE